MPNVKKNCNNYVTFRNRNELKKIKYLKNR